MDKILSYLELGRQEGAQVLIGGARAELGGELAGGYYVQPTLFKGHNQMRIFREEIFGPVLAVTTFKDEAEALQIANDTPYGLGAGVWTRDGSRAYRMGRASRPAACGPTATTPTRRTRPSAATRNRASAAKPQGHARPLPADQEPAGELLARTRSA
jgi:hypothetical protein